MADMADALAKQPTETPKAALAFQEFVALGADRSLRKLADSYVRQNRYRTASTALRIFADWSVKYHWQARLANAATARSEELLNEAFTIDAETFTITSRNLRRQVEHYKDFPDATIKIRESVRKSMPKGTASVNVGVNITLTIEQQQIVERIAASRGLDVDEVMDELQAILKAKA